MFNWLGKRHLHAFQQGLTARIACPVSLVETLLARGRLWITGDWPTGSRGAALPRWDSRRLPKAAIVSTPRQDFSEHPYMAAMQGRCPDGPPSAEKELITAQAQYVRTSRGASGGKTRGARLKFQRVRSRGPHSRVSKRVRRRSSGNGQGAQWILFSNKYGKMQV